MDVLDLFRLLSHGELSNLAMGNEGSGSIRAESQPRLVTYIDEALLRLYSRFPLKERELLLELHAHLPSYRLLPRFARTYIPSDDIDNEPIRYIRDTEQNPFTGDLIKVLMVGDTAGVELPLNDDQHYNSLFTPNPTTLQVPRPKNGMVLSIVYQARHQQIQGNLATPIEIPDVFLGALTAYVAYKVFSHMNTQESTAKAQEHLAMYEKICADATEYDLTNSAGPRTNTRFSTRGWI